MFTNLKNLGFAELEDLRKAVDREIAVRAKDKADELIENFIDAANALVDKAPHVSLDMEFMCGDCCHFERVDILHAFREERLSVDNFKKW